MVNDQFLVAYAESGIRQYESYINCEIINISPVYSVQLAWAMQKHSPFYLAFDHYIRRLKEIGAIQRYDKRYEIKDQRCPDYSGKPLSINQCITAFNVLVVGVFGGLSWFLLEVIVPRQHIKQFYMMGDSYLRKLLIKVSKPNTDAIRAISTSNDNNDDALQEIKRDWHNDIILSFRRNEEVMKKRIQYLEQENMYLKQNNK